MKTYQEAPWLFQGMQLLRLLEAAKELSNIQCMPSAAMAFPAAEVQTLVRQKTLILRVMGLYGVDAPLPHYFLQATLSDTEASAQILRDFLNIFNHRLYQLLYMAWKKTQPLVLLEQESPRYLNYLTGISGNALQFHHGQEFAYAGLFGRRVHSASGLKMILKDFLSAVNVEIQQFIPCWEPIVRSPALGKQYVLGKNSLVGERILDSAQQICITLGPVNIERARQWLSDQPEGKRLRALIQLYVEPHLIAQLVVEITADRTAVACLGETILLGWQSWIGTPVAGKTYELRI